MFKNTFNLVLSFIADCGICVCRSPHMHLIAGGKSQTLGFQLIHVERHFSKNIQ